MGNIYCGRMNEQRARKISRVRAREFDLESLRDRSSGGPSREREGERERARARERARGLSVFFVEQLSTSHGNELAHNSPTGSPTNLGCGDVFSSSKSDRQSSLSGLARTRRPSRSAVPLAEVRSLSRNLDNFLGHCVPRKP